MCDKDKRPVSVYMPTELIVESRVAAAKRNMSRSAFITEAVERAILESQQQRRGQSSGTQQSEGK
jgi:metal-responsive CopG/Arc/MetJ family transcriptional regulator